jgi:regulator of protease activity HflC (stomatin/prohibitin superfamily)
MTDVDVEAKVSKQFREFADAERQRLIERRYRQQTEDRANRLKELLRFSKTFKLKTPVPDDLVGILARGSGRQEDIIEKAQQQYEHGNSAGAAETSSATVADSTGLAQAPPSSNGGGRRKRNKKNKKRGAAPQPVRTNYTNSVLDFARDD